jgi:hypothetical protein
MEIILKNEMVLLIFLLLVEIVLKNKENIMLNGITNTKKEKNLLGKLKKDI